MTPGERVARRWVIAITLGLMLGALFEIVTAEHDVRVRFILPETPTASATADRSSIAPILPPADLEAMLNGAEEAQAASGIRMGSEAVRSSAAADPASTPYLLEAPVEATPGGVTAARADGDTAARSGFESRPGDSPVLTSAGLRALLDAGGWPSELAEQGVRVACGPAVTRQGVPVPTGESGCDPSAVGAAGELGLFQLLPAWADDCELNVGDLYQPAENATCALWILTYEEQQGLAPWHHWSVRP